MSCNLVQWQRNIAGSIISRLSTLALPSPLSGFRSGLIIKCFDVKGENCWLTGVAVLEQQIIQKLTAETEKKRHKTFHYSSRLQTEVMRKAPACFHWDGDLNHQNGGEASKPRTKQNKKANWMIRLGGKGLFIRIIYKIGWFPTHSTDFCTFAEFKALNASRRSRLIRRLPRAPAHERQQT